jgi:hypothetical protein
VSQCATYISFPKRHFFVFKFWCYIVLLCDTFDWCPTCAMSHTCLINHWQVSLVPKSVIKCVLVSDFNKVREVGEGSKIVFYAFSRRLCCRPKAFFYISCKHMYDIKSIRIEFWTSVRIWIGFIQKFIFRLRLGFKKVNMTALIFNIFQIIDSCTAGSILIELIRQFGSQNRSESGKPKPIY